VLSTRDPYLQQDDEEREHYSGSSSAALGEDDGPIKNVDEWQRNARRTLRDLGDWREAANLRLNTLENNVGGFNGFEEALASTSKDFNCCYRAAGSVRNLVWKGGQTSQWLWGVPIPDR